MISVYDYTDYRCFLKERVSELKKADSRFSYRYFNRLAGVKSSGFLKLVMDGHRNLGVEGIGMIARGLKLAGDERKYFETLVRFNQSGNHQEKDHCFKELSSNKRFLEAKSLTAAQYKLFSHWYYVAILELVRLGSNTVKNINWLQRRLDPPVGLKEIKKAVSQLKEIDLLYEDEFGNLSKKDKMITTPDEVKSLALTNFHIQMSELASRAVTETKGHEREFSTLTIAASEAAFQKAKKEIQSFRKKLHSILEQEAGGAKTHVAHINLQLFKLSKNGGVQ